MSSIRYILISARALIADPARWTQWAPARSADGTIVDPDSPHAVAWCLTGAIRRASGDFNDLVVGVELALFPHLPASAFGSIRYLNDRTGHRHIIEILDRAIEALPAEDTAAAKETAMRPEELQRA